MTAMTSCRRLGRGRYKLIDHVVISNTSEALSLLAAAACAIRKQMSCSVFYYFGREL